MLMDSTSNPKALEVIVGDALSYIRIQHYSISQERGTRRHRASSTNSKYCSFSRAILSLL